MIGLYLLYGSCENFEVFRRLQNACKTESLLGPTFHIGEGKADFRLVANILQSPVFRKANCNFVCFTDVAMVTKKFGAGAMFSS